MDPQDLPRGPEGEPATIVPPGVEPYEAGPLLTFFGADGPHALGPATIDSDADGVADTALVPPPRPADRDLFSLATDLDRDGDVDVLTTVSADGSAHTLATAAPGGAAWDPGWDAAAPPASILDPATGVWTRSA